MKTLFITLIAGALLAGVAEAVPGLIRFDGRLIADNEEYNGNGIFKFALVSDVATEWTHDGSPGPEPSAFLILPVRDGRFTVLLGSSPQEPLPSAVLDNPGTTLRVWFSSDGGGSFTRLSPDTRIGAVAYTVRAQKVVPSSVRSSHLKSGAVTDRVLATNAVDSSAIGVGAVDNSDLAENSVDGAKLASGSIQADALEAGLVKDQLSNNGLHVLGSGGIVLSLQKDNTDLNASGYDQSGHMIIPGEGWRSFESGATPLTDRAGHSMLWTGNRVLVWGGRDSSGNLRGDGFLFDPVSGSLSQIATSGDPAAREFHTAVWTGSEMLVWGGNTVSGVANTGGRYDPATDSWQSIPTAAAPIARTGHTAVWTGSGMLVFGGETGAGSALASGAEYVPDSNSWIPIPSGPSARVGHGAVWTGAAMVVWGGRNGSTYFFDGSRYTPGSGWSSTASSGAPLGRAGHAMSWTGERVLVWGGERAGAGLNDGALYDPEANSWESLPTDFAPLGRNNPATASTPFGALLWGGERDGSPLDSGRIYDHLNDRWLPVPRGGPRAFGAVPMVWTGNQFVVNGPDSGRPGYGQLWALSPDIRYTLYAKP